MKILNYGSLNLDFVYAVPHFVAAGETLASTSRQVFPGGKGLNQSVALARAGAHVYHAGAVGAEGGQLVELLKQNGVDVSFLRVRTDCPTGHAMIQVNKSGQNCILLYGGANQSHSKDEIAQALCSFGSGDMLLLQNEINELQTILRAAKARQMMVALNPSPMTQTLLKAPLELVDIFILNEIEAYDICGEQDCEKQLCALKKLYPRAEIVLTLGKKGVLCLTSAGERYEYGTYDVPVVDTTAAGDTFTGFYLASIAAKRPVEQALKLASAASSISVSRAGASVSIPTLQEAEQFLAEHPKSVV